MTSTIPFIVDESIQAELAALDGPPMRQIMAVPVGGPADGFGCPVDAAEGEFVSGRFLVGNRWHEYRSRERVSRDSDTLQIFHHRIWPSTSEPERDHQ